VGGKLRTQSFPKFDEPVPAVTLNVEANDELYAAWQHMLLDQYPRALNLDQVRSRLAVPDFLQGVYERNLAEEAQVEYEDWNTFDDGIAYFLKVDAEGAVTNAKANGSGAYSGGAWGIYPPLLMQLRFEPGRIRGRAVPCQVLANVDHTFIEGKRKRKR
jgi:hypothetical protein